MDGADSEYCRIVIRMMIVADAKRGSGGGGRGEERKKLLARIIRELMRL